MKKIIDHIKEEWYKYVLEVLVITIGILGAFALNNWNEERQARATEKVILTNLKTEVEANVDILGETMRRHWHSFYCGSELLKLFGTDVSDIPSSQLDSIISYAETVWTFESRDGTIKSIISSGNLDYIQNDSLKAMITSFDGEVINATQETEHTHRLLHERLWPEIDGKINSSERLRAWGYDLPPGAYKSDYQWMFNNKRVEDIISNITSWHKATIDDEQNLMNYLLKFQDLINRELSRQENK